MIKGEIGDNTDEERLSLYKTRGDRGEMIGNNTERNGRGYTKQGVAEGERSATIRKGKAEAMENKGRQRGKDW